MNVFETSLFHTSQGAAQQFVVEMGTFIFFPLLSFLKMFRIKKLLKLVDFSPSYLKNKRSLLYIALDVG